MTDKPDEQPVTEKPTVKIEIDAAPKGEWKALGGSDHDQWNDRLSTLVTRALPVNQKNVETISHAGSAAAAGIVDMKPADPIEGVLISQIVVANEAAMNLYRLGWANSAEYFEASTKYLQLADKASRTVAMLTERLDHHRNRGRLEGLPDAHRRDLFGQRLRGEAAGPVAPARTQGDINCHARESEQR